MATFKIELEHWDEDTYILVLDKNTGDYRSSNYIGRALPLADAEKVKDWLLRAINDIDSVCRQEPHITHEGTQSLIARVNHIHFLHLTGNTLDELSHSLRSIYGMGHCEFDGKYLWAVISGKKYLCKLTNLVGVTTLFESGHDETKPNASRLF